MKTTGSHEKWQVLRECQRLLTLTFGSARPSLVEVFERIGHLRRRVSEGARAAAYELRVGPWFEEIGGLAPTRTVEAFGLEGAA